MTELNRTEYLLTGIAGNRDMTRMMHGLDMFEDWKHIGGPVELRVTLKDGADLTESVRKLYEASQDTQYPFLALFAVNHPESLCVNPRVKAFSDGTQWGLMADWLKYQGVTTEAPSL
jgi:hypothetical protein